MAKVELRRCQQHYLHERTPPTSAAHARHAGILKQSGMSAGELRQGIRSPCTTGSGLERTTLILTGDMATAHTGRRPIQIQATSLPGVTCSRSGRAAAPRPGFVIDRVFVA